MPLTVSGPSPAATEAVVRQVAGFVTALGGDGRRLAAADRSALALVVAHPVYTATLADAESGDVGRAAVHTDWRYLVQEGDETIATADATLDDTAPTVTHVGEGPFGPATARAVAVAEALPQVQSGTYELRTLRVPALKVVALWLHGDDDLYVPLEPAGAGLTPYEVYDGERFNGVLAAAALRLRRLPPDAVS